MDVVGRRGANRALGGALLLGLLGACSSARSSGSSPSSVRDQDTPQIGLRRGSRWSVVSIKPPHLTGPHFHLILKEGVLSGSISGASAPSGSLRVEIAEDGADGYGPLGPVSMDFIDTPDSTVADGMWNGHRVHLVFRRESITGTVADNSDTMVGNDPDAQRGMQMFRNRRATASASSSPNQFDPLPRNSSCEYFLTELSSDGALMGGSTCSGMPEQTRLEVPQEVQSWLTRPELVTLLVAVLSAPPIVAAENLGLTHDMDPPPPPRPRR